MLFSDLLPIPCMFVDYKWVRCSSSAGRVQQNTDNAFSFLGQRPSLCQYPSSIFAIPPAAQHILPINATALISRSRPFLCLFLLSRCQIDLGHTVHDFRQRCPNQGSKSLSCSLLILFRATACGIFALSEVCNEICRI